MGISIVTGANSGIGKAAATALSGRGETVILACRSLERGARAATEIRSVQPGATVDVMELDLSSVKSVRAFCDLFSRRYDALHLLINNAANFDLAQRDPVICDSGAEAVFTTNHLGPFLLTTQLLPIMKRSAPARIINIASKGLVMYPRLDIEFDNFDGSKRFSPQHAYYHSKLAQLIFTLDLAHRLAGTGVTVNCIRVPSVQVEESRYADVSPILRAVYRLKRAKAITPGAMAHAYVSLALDPEFADTNGAYLDEHLRPVRPNRNAGNPANWDRLWNESARLTGGHVEIVK